MGYYTSFELDVIGEGTYNVEIKGAVDENGNPIKAFRSVPYDVEDMKNEIANDVGYSYMWGDTIKWYAHEADMKVFSKKYPEVVFVLEGKGEEPGDLWKKYFKNGKMQAAYAEIVIS